MRVYTIRLRLLELLPKLAVPVFDGPKAELETL